MVHDRVMEYEEGTDYLISTALDGGEEEDIRRELCAYIDASDYNPKIKKFINSVKWLDGDDGKDYSKVFNILGESKEIKMTVKELIEKLNEFDENLPVYVNDSMGGGYPVSDMISVKEFTDGRKFVEIE